MLPLNLAKCVGRKQLLLAETNCPTDSSVSLRSLSAWVYPFSLNTSSKGSIYNNFISQLRSLPSSSWRIVECIGVLSARWSKYESCDTDLLCPAVPDSFGDGGDRYSRQTELRTEVPLPAPEINDSALFTLRNRLFTSGSGFFEDSWNRMCNNSVFEWRKCFKL